MTDLRRESVSRFSSCSKTRRRWKESKLEKEYGIENKNNIMTRLPLHQYTTIHRVSRSKSFFPRSLSFSLFFSQTCTTGSFTQGERERESVHGQTDRQAVMLADESGLRRTDGRRREARRTSWISTQAGTSSSAGSRAHPCKLIDLCTHKHTCTFKSQDS